MPNAQKNQSLKYLGKKDKLNLRTQFLYLKSKNFFKFIYYYNLYYKIN